MDSTPPAPQPDRPLAEAPCPTADLILGTLFAWGELQDWLLGRPDAGCVAGLDRPTAARVSALRLLHTDAAGACRLHGIAARLSAGTLSAARDTSVFHLARDLAAGRFDHPSRAPEWLFALTTDPREPVNRLGERLRQRMQTAAMRAWRFDVAQAAVPAQA